MKHIIASKCSKCSCSLWFNNLTNAKNYFYVRGKYICRECFYGVKI